MTREGKERYEAKVKAEREADKIRRAEVTAAKKRERTCRAIGCNAWAGRGLDVCDHHNPEKVCGAPTSKPGHTCRALKTPGADTCWDHDPENRCAEPECTRPLHRVNGRYLAHCDSHDPGLMAERAAELQRRASPRRPREPLVLQVSVPAGDVMDAAERFGVHDAEGFLRHLGIEVRYE